MFSPVDWFLVGIYLISAFGIGIAVTRSASSSLSSYFIAGRTLPWWWLGTSMVATTFASDTPLAITGIIASSGVSGNWFWWSWALTFITVTVFFARRWRTSEVLTDVELITIRYDGPQARFLRLFKSFYFSIIINCIILGWVFRAMSKITTPFIQWENILGSQNYSALAAVWPGFLVFDNLNNTLSVLVIFTIVIAYSSLGGIRGVILTDLFQFVLAVLTTILFAVLAVDHVGGLSQLFSSLNEIYPDKAEDFIRFMPDFDNVLFPFQIFLIYMGVQWWAKYWSDGSGYIAQRLNAARTPEDAEKGALWFTIANFLIRTWPWVMIGLVALVVFPLDDPTRYHQAGDLVISDREMGYPALMKVILPPGILGLTFVSLMAAFMSTVDTHINWGTSYLINDIYKPYVRPEASEKELIIASRTGIFLMGCISILVASQISSIEQAWKFFISIASGLGLPQILRWVWWRANAWTEISGMLTALILSIILYTILPDTRADYLLFYIASSSVLVSVLVTMITNPVNETLLKGFVKKVKPFGLWPERFGVSRDRSELIHKSISWLIGVAMVYSGMFSIGYVLKLYWVTGLLLAMAFIVLLYIMIKRLEQST